MRDEVTLVRLAAGKRTLQKSELLSIAWMREPFAQLARSAVELPYRCLEQRAGLWPLLQGVPL